MSKSAQDLAATPPAEPLYSLAHLTLIGATPPELVYIAARAGYEYKRYSPEDEGCDLRTVHKTGPTDDD